MSDVMNPVLVSNTPTTIDVALTLGTGILIAITAAIILIRAEGYAAGLLDAGSPPAQFGGQLHSNTPPN